LQDAGMAGPELVASQILRRIGNRVAFRLLFSISSLRALLLSLHGTNSHSLMQQMLRAPEQERV
jgi:hypothetical protein